MLTLRETYEAWSDLSRGWTSVLLAMDAAARELGGGVFFVRSAGDQYAPLHASMAYADSMHHAGGYPACPTDHQLAGTSAVTFHTVQRGLDEIYTTPTDVNLLARQEDTPALDLSYIASLRFAIAFPLGGPAFYHDVILGDVEQVGEGVIAIPRMWRGIECVDYVISTSPEGALPFTPPAGASCDAWNEARELFMPKFALRTFDPRISHAPCHTRLMYSDCWESTRHGYALDGAGAYPSKGPVLRYASLILPSFTAAGLISVEDRDKPHVITILNALLSEGVLRSTQHEAAHAAFPEFVPPLERLGMFLTEHSETAQQSPTQGAAAAQSAYDQGTRENRAALAKRITAAEASVQDARDVLALAPDTEELVASLRRAHEEGLITQAEYRESTRTLYIETTPYRFGASEEWIAEGNGVPGKHVPGRYVMPPLYIVKKIDTGGTTVKFFADAARTRKYPHPHTEIMREPIPCLGYTAEQKKAREMEWNAAWLKSVYDWLLAIRDYILQANTVHSEGAHQPLLNFAVLEEAYEERGAAAFDGAREDDDDDDDETFTCETCGEEHDDMDSLRGDYCDACWRDHHCERCDSAIYPDNGPMCYDCYSETHCRECGDEESTEFLRDHDGYCERCYTSTHCRECGDERSPNFLRSHDGLCEACIPEEEPDESE